MQNLYLIVYCLIYFVSTYLVGKKIISFIEVKFENKFEANVFSFALGNIFYSLIFLFLGIFHVLFKEILLILYLIPIVINSVSLLLRPKRLIFLKLTKLDGFEIFSIILLVFIFFPMIPQLFLYPTSWDPLAYHLTLPKLYLSIHSFPFFYYFPQTAFPIGIESLYGFGEVFKDPRIGNFINFNFLFLTSIYIMYGLRNIFDKKILILATFVYIFRHLLFTEVSVTPFVDYGFAFFSLLCASSLYKFLSTKYFGWLTITGILAIFLSSIKVSGIFITISAVFVILLFTLIEYYKNHSRLFSKVTNKQKIVFALLLLFVFVPTVFWYLRNWYLAGNPVYPFLNGFFKGVNYNPNIRGQLAEIRESNLFYAITKYNLLHGKDTTLDYIFATDVLSFVMFMIFAVISLFDKDRIVKYLSIFAIVGTVPIALLTGPLTRYYLPMIPILALITCRKVFISLTDKKLKIINLILILIFLIVVFMQIDTGFNQRINFLVVKPKLTFLSSFIYSQDLKNLKEQDNYPMIDYINKNLDKTKDNVVVVFDNRLYYLDVASRFDDPSINGYFTNPETKDENEIYAKMKNDKVTYVLVSTNWGTYKNLRSDIYMEFVKKYLTKVHTEKGINEPIGLTLYKLK